VRLGIWINFSWVVGTVAGFLVGMLWAAVIVP
jgi:hypothetical protein